MPTQTLNSTKAASMGGSSDGKKKKRKNPTTTPSDAAAAMHHLREDRLAQEREHSRQQKLEKESLQFLKAQQKLIGKKSTDEFARIRIVRPQDRTSRQRNLHQNGKPLGPGNISTDFKAHTNLDHQDDTGHHSGRLQSARGERTTASALSDAALKKKLRPQSAKPVLQNVKQHAAAVNADAPLIGQRISVRRLENCSYNPASLSTTANILSTSQSAPRLHMPHSFLRRSTTEESNSKHDNEKSASTATVLPFGPSSLVTESGRTKHHIVVHMQRLVLDDDDEDQQHDTADHYDSVRSSDAAALSPRHGCVRSAWGE